jgi:hypothetical protein
MHWPVIRAELLEARSEIELIVFLGGRCSLSPGKRLGLLDPLPLLPGSRLLALLYGPPECLVLVKPLSLGLPLPPPLSLPVLLLAPRVVSASGPPLVLSLLVAIRMVDCISLEVLCRQLYNINQGNFLAALTIFIQV